MIILLLSWLCGPEILAGQSKDSVSLTHNAWNHKGDDDWIDEDDWDVSTGAMCLRPQCFSRWCLLELDFTTWYLHSHSWQLVDAASLLVAHWSYQPVPTWVLSNWLGLSTAWGLAFESEYSKRENSKRHRQKGQGFLRPSLRSPRKSLNWSSRSLKPAQIQREERKRFHDSEWPLWRQVTTYHPSGPNKFLPHAKYTHPLLRPSKVSSHYGISLMSRILISNSGPSVTEVP